MYTWGYIRESSLSKLDLELDDADGMGMLKKFPTYANEVMTQVCSSVKPKPVFYEIVIDHSNVGVILTIDDADFIAFGDGVSTIETDIGYGTKLVEECHDDVLEFLGYNQFVCKVEGKYRISYNARWYTFGYDTPEDLVLPVPADILDCIPSYIAHQCFKVDDEYKSSVFRNEYEMFFARIDDTKFSNTKTFKIGGDW